MAMPATGRLPGPPRDNPHQEGQDTRRRRGAIGAIPEAQKVGAGDEEGKRQPQTPPSKSASELAAIAKAQKAAAEELKIQERILDQREAAVAERERKIRRKEEWFAKHGGRIDF